MHLNFNINSQTLASRCDCIIRQGVSCNPINIDEVPDLAMAVVEFHYIPVTFLKWKFFATRQVPG